MKVKFAFRKEGLTVNLPDYTAVSEPVHIPGLKNEKEKAIDAMRNPIGTKPLIEMVNETDRVAILISEGLTPNHKLVPWIIEELIPVPLDQFVIIYGNGTQRDKTMEELTLMLGEDIVKSVRIIHNNAFDKDTQKYLGTTSSGAVVYFNKEYYESNFKIVTGTITPNLFDWLSGGLKGIMPGIAGIDTIKHFQSARIIGDTKSTWGKMEGDSVKDEAAEACIMAKPDFMLNVTLNSDKEITNYFSGDVIKSLRAGSEYLKKYLMAGWM